MIIWHIFFAQFIRDVFWYGFEYACFKIILKFCLLKSHNFKMYQEILQYHLTALLVSLVLTYCDFQQNWMTNFNTSLTKLWIHWNNNIKRVSNTQSISRSYIDRVGTTRIISLYNYLTYLYPRWNGMLRGSWMETNLAPHITNGMLSFWIPLVQYMSLILFWWNLIC